jgi:hypothetical protein
VHRRDGGDLSVEKRPRPTRRSEARALEGVPARRTLPVGHDPHAGDDLRPAALELRTAPRAGQALDAEPHLVHDERCGDEFVGVLGESALHAFPRRG